jgi:chromosome segregation ATPase
VPVVRLEVRMGTARAATHEVPDSGFLIGTVAGCDLRLPGVDLPPLICLLTPSTHGLQLRKLAALAPIQVDAQLPLPGILADGARLNIGGNELRVHVTGHKARSTLASPASTIASANETSHLNGIGEKEREAFLRVWEEQLIQQRHELAHVQAEMLAIRQEIHDRYEQRRVRLGKLHDGIRRAAKNLQTRKRQLDVQAAIAFEQARHQESVALTNAPVAEREKQLAQREQELHKLQTQYQSDLVRLDRLQASLETRQQQFQERAQEIDQEREELQRTGRELEEQAQALGTLHDNLRREETRIEQLKQEQRTSQTALAQRTAAIEGQQTMLASLRSRLERMREEVRAEHQQTLDQRTDLEVREAELAARIKEADQLRAGFEADDLACKEQQRLLEQRQGALEAAVAQVREIERSLSTKEADLDARSHELELQAQQQRQEADELGVKAKQVLEMQDRLGEDRRVLKEREEKQAPLEQARLALQDQLRRRSEELAERQKQLVEQARLHAEATGSMQARLAEIEQERLAVAKERLDWDQGNDERLAQLERQSGDLARREYRCQTGMERLRTIGRKIGARRKTQLLAEAEQRRQHLEAEQALAQGQRDILEIRRELTARMEQLPDLEQQAQDAISRLEDSRSQLRAHVTELHGYAKASREDLDAWRNQVRAQADDVQRQQQSLHQAREDHRLAVAAFRQQLIEWQGQVAELKRTLAQGETRLSRRQAAVDEQVRRMDAASLVLAEQAEVLQVQEQEMARQRDEVVGHLDDLREWYRRKIRELSKSRLEDAGTKRPPTRELLSVTGKVDPADQKLGELLRQLKFVDEDTLTALLVEAHQQRRSLRQALLSGGYLTIYQMALIEAGEVDALGLGPLRVIDRIRVTPREAVYRVFDPRRGRDAVLRHLAADEMQDAVRPDEFRQRFAQAASIQHPHVATVLEVLDIGGRPAVEEELLIGLPATEWPALAGIPGVWYRLICQAALALQAAHDAGLTHGRIDSSVFMLTSAGVLKLCGLGEPPWLSGLQVTGDGSDVANDLAGLGSCAAAWAALAGPRRGPKTKAYPQSLQAIVERLSHKDPAQRYTDVVSLLADLDRAGNDLPANAEAWDRLLRYIRDNESEPTALRRSA